MSSLSSTNSDLHWFSRLFNSAFPPPVWMFEPVGRYATHTDRQEAHAIKRARERYNLDLTSDEYLLFCDRIRIGNMSAERVSADDNIWRIKHKGTDLYVAWDVTTQRIATFLPREDGRVQKAMSKRHDFRLNIPKDVRPIQKAVSNHNRDLTKYRQPLGK